MALAQVTEEDPFAGMPEPASFVRLEDDLRLYFDDVYSLPGPSASNGRGALKRPLWLPTRASPTPTAAASTRLPDARCWPTRADLLGELSHQLRRRLSRTAGRGYQRRRCSATAGGASARSFALLESPESVGAEAARRTLRRLGARARAHAAVPIVFAPEVARSLIGSIFEAAIGRRHLAPCFLSGRQAGEQIAHPSITIIDDDTMMLPSGVGGFGTSPFDGEGLPSRRTVVVENGVLQNYLLNTYTARKLGMQSTHNASRGLAGTPGIGCGNLYLEPGSLHAGARSSPAIPAGLYVTEPDGLRRQHGHRRLLARRDGPLDRERRADARGGRRSPLPAIWARCSATSPLSAMTSSFAAPSPRLRCASTE